MFRVPLDCEPVAANWLEVTGDIVSGRSRLLRAQGAPGRGRRGAKAQCTYSQVRAVASCRTEHGTARCLRIARRPLVAEVTHAGEYHCHAVFIRGSDDLFIADGTAGLYDGGNAALACAVDAIAEGEEGV